MQQALTKQRPQEPWLSRHCCCASSTPRCCCCRATLAPCSCCTAASRACCTAAAAAAQNTRPSQCCAASSTSRGGQASGKGVGSTTASSNTARTQCPSCTAIPVAHATAHTTTCCTVQRPETRSAPDTAAVPRTTARDVCCLNLICILRK